jgi:carbamoyltransferase
MKVLGISGRVRDAAAALAVDGCVVAAASEDCFTKVQGIGYGQTGGFPTSAVEACLGAAGLRLADVEQVTVVDDEGSERTETTSEVVRTMFRANDLRGPVLIDALQADAVQAAASAASAGAVLVCSTQPPAMAAFVRDGDELKPQGRPLEAGALFSAAGALANSLGVPAQDPFRALDRLSVGGESEFEDDLAAAIEWQPAIGVQVDEDRLWKLVGRVGGQLTSSLSEASSLNVRVQGARRALAASFTCRVARVVREAASTLCGRDDVRSIAFGGAMLGNPRLTTELRQLVGDGLSMAAVPELAGRALGAALSASGGRDRLPGLALGPAFADNEIKRTLDNCRLDYVYEPDWRRLLLRVSKMLSQGKVVAWFQGAMGFGPRALGTRSILCDPSSRYARQNMNEYLRQVPLDEPLPVVFAPTVASECLTRPVSSPLAVVDAAVKDEWRDRLVAALDWRHYVRVHGASPTHSPELCDLLEAHYSRTTVPALIETNLCGPGEPVACTPRDAVKTMYSSPIDALIIGRFVLMKDYWLLRNNAD